MFFFIHFQLATKLCIAIIICYGATQTQSAESRLVKPLSSPLLLSMISYTVILDAFILACWAIKTRTTDKHSHHVQMKMMPCWEKLPYTSVWKAVCISLCVHVNSVHWVINRWRDVTGGESKPYRPFTHAIPTYVLTGGGHINKHLDKIIQSITTHTHTELQNISDRAPTKIYNQPTALDHIILYRCSCYFVQALYIINHEKWLLIKKTKRGRKGAHFEM